jgi:hypothetical protein
MNTERNPFTRDLYKAAGLFGRWIQEHETFIASDFTAFAREHGLISKRVRSHIKGIIAGFRFAGLITRTADFRRDNSNVPPSPIWQSNFYKKKENNDNSTQN